MPLFRVLVHGHGIHIPATAESEAIIGFYASRVVRASNPTSAEKEALSRLRGEWARPPLSMHNKGAAPDFIVEQVSLLTFFHALRTSSKGFTFYSQE